MQLCSREHIMLSSKNAYQHSALILCRSFINFVDLPTSRGGGGGTKLAGISNPRS